MTLTMYAYGLLIYYMNHNIHQTMENYKGWVKMNIHRTSTTFFYYIFFQYQVDRLAQPWSVTPH